MPRRREDADLTEPLPGFGPRKGFARRCGLARRRRGTSREAVVCACGRVNWFHCGSWARNGHAKCLRCGRWVDYRDLRCTKTRKSVKRYALEKVVMPTMGGIR